jgi:hypothetical protein
MEGLIPIQEKFRSCCFSLDEGDIYKLDKEDNGPINNVIANLADQCYGAKLYDDLTVDMFFVVKPGRLRGDIITLHIDDPDYYILLMKFCSMLADENEQVDALGAFNTFQSRLRGFLEKNGYFTISSLELEQFKGKDAVGMVVNEKGYKVLRFIDKKNYYRNFFNNNINIPKSKDKNYVYLMLNEDTSLIKIGYSNDPSYRERTLHSKEPAVHLIACWEASKEKERALHKMFDSKRRRGEWFRLTFPELAELEKYMNN